MPWTSHHWLAPTDIGGTAPIDLDTRTPEPRPSARARPVRARRRRALAKSLRLVANRTPAGDRERRGFEVLLCERVASVRTELRELADVLERHDDPDPRWVAEVNRLLTDGCRSPLYNPDVHVSELRATLYYLRAGLSRSAALPPTS